mmetsp:Transcript_4481/g.6596  ORF Transcript_4481/g.6596 Transcript_4481/m.6596 type:complete len:923 (+) Transcript_4481:133-2901(+)
MPATFRILIRDQYGNARANGGHELVSRLRSSQCETASPHACQPMGTQVPSSSASSGKHVAGGAPLSSGVMRVPLNLTHTAACNMSRGQLLVPLDPDAEFAALSFEQAQAALATRGVAVGRWVVFVGGACTGRWAQIATLNVSRRCLDLVSVWPDALPACVPSPAEAAAAGDVAYVVGSAPWARLALPPLDCLSCPQRHVRTEVQQLDAAGHVSVRAAPSAVAPTSAQLHISGSTQHARTAGVDQGWHYAVSYAATRKGQYSVVTSLVGPPGLMATYYSAPTELDRDSAAHSSGGAPTGTQVWGLQWQHQEYAVDWSSSRTSGHTDGNLGLVPHASLAPDASSFGVRWSGFMRAHETRQYTLRVKVGGDSTAGSAQHDGAGERLRLWVDNSLLIDQWTSLSSFAPSGTIGLPQVQSNLFDVELVYKCMNTSAGCGVRLLWDELSGAGGSWGEMQRLPFNSSFQRFDVPNDLGHLLVLPAEACASRSYVRGTALTLATAGVDASFRIYSRDAYENDNERSLKSSLRFGVEISGAGKSPILTPSTQALLQERGSSYSTYTATVSQSYFVAVSLQAHLLAHSPHSLLVKPAAFCASMSTVQGAGISVATVAPTVSTFVIQARDSYGNARTSATPVIDGDGWHVRVYRTNSPLHYLPPFPPSTHAGSADALVALPTTKASLTQGDSLSRIHGHYMIPPDPWDETIQPTLHISWAKRGGLHATYYTSASSSHGEAEGDVELPEPCETSQLPRSHVQLALPFANVTHPGAGAVDLKAALSSCPNVALTQSKLIIRYHGMIAGCEASPALCPGGGFFERNFNWTVTQEDRVKLWIDNSLLIDQWTSLSSRSPTATLRFLERDAVSDVAAYFQRTISSNTSSAQASTVDANAIMNLIDDGTITNSSSPLIPTTRLLLVTDLSASPFGVVLP